MRTMIRFTTILTVVGVVGVAALFLHERQAQGTERRRNAALRQQLEYWTRVDAESRSPAPRVSMPAAASSLPGQQWHELLRLRGELGVLRQEKTEVVRLRTENARLRSNWVEQLARGKRLSVRQVEPYLKANHRSPQSLAVAARVTGDRDLLREAVESGSSDARIHFAAYFELKEEALPGYRRQRLEALKEAAPDNALANYLSAQDCFRLGQKDQAVRELLAASGKPKFEDYYLDWVSGAQEAYEAAGLSSLEAMEAASTQPLPQLAELKGLGQNLVELARLYRDGGDEASAQMAQQMGVTLGRQVTEGSGPGLVIGEFVGIAIERQVLETLDPSSSYDAEGHSIKDRLEALTQQRESRKMLLKQAESLLRALPEPDRMTYFERLRTSGEAEALRWVASRQGGP